jgi:hypothetical protein
MNRHLTPPRHHLTVQIREARRYATRRLPEECSVRSTEFCSLVLQLEFCSLGCGRISVELSCQGPEKRRVGKIEGLSRPALLRATASLEARRGRLRLVSPSRARHGKARCVTSHQSEPPLHNQWSRLVYLVCVPFWNTGPYSLVSQPPTCAVQKPEKWRQHRQMPGNK